MKLYIVLNKDLPTGLKMAQACHALRQFVGEYPHIDQFWYLESNNIVVLQHDDITELVGELESRGIRLSQFHEPDLDGQLTAICVEPAGGKYLSNVPLAKGEVGEKSAAA